MDAFLILFFTTNSHVQLTRDKLNMFNCCFHIYSV